MEKKKYLVSVRLAVHVEADSEENAVAISHARVYGEDDDVCKVTNATIVDMVCEGESELD